MGTFSAQIANYYPSSSYSRPRLEAVSSDEESYKPATARRQLYGRLLGILIAPLPHATCYDDVDLP